MKYSALIIAGGLSLGIASARNAEAQLFYVGVRAGAGVPTGDFAEKVSGTAQSAPLRAATPGLGYGLDAGFGAGPVGFYASYDRIRFGCASGYCEESGKYELNGFSAGVRIGVPLFPLFKPWAKAGLTYHEMTGRFPGSSGTAVTTGRSPGYEVGAGVDIPILGGFFSLSPQGRYIRQKLEPTISSSSVRSGGKRSADFYTFDIGLRVRSPI